MVQSHYFQLLILKQCFVVAIMVVIVVIVVVVVMLVLVMVVFTCKQESREVTHYELAIPRARDQEGVEVSTGYCWKNCCFICGCEV